MLYCFSFFECVVVSCDESVIELAAVPFARWLLSAYLQFEGFENS